MDLVVENKPIEVPQEKSFFGIIIHSFFVVPFLIAVFAVLLFVSVRLLTIEKRTIYDYLGDVKTGSLNKRWQSAFELSKILANPSLIPTDQKFVSELNNAFDHSKHDDDRVRQYLALAMGRTQNHAFTDTLINALKDESENNLSALIYALGMLQDKKAAPALESYLDHADAKIRLASAIALGNIGNTKAVSSLKKTLYDSEPNVRWDSAIALAKLGDSSGKGVLLNLLDRKFFLKFPEVDSEEQTRAVLASIQAAGLLHDANLNRRIEELSQSDQNMNVRKMAIEVLKK